MPQASDDKNQQPQLTDADKQANAQTANNNPVTAATTIPTTGQPVVEAGAEDGQQSGTEVDVGTASGGQSADSGVGSAADAQTGAGTGVQSAGDTGSVAGTDTGAVPADGQSAAQQGDDANAGGDGSSAVDQGAQDASGQDQPPVANAGTGSASAAGDIPPAPGQDADASGSGTAADTGSVGSDGQDSGLDPVHQASVINGTSSPQELAAYLDGLTPPVAYKFTQGAADGQVGPPVWIFGDDLNTLVANNPGIQGLIDNETILKSTVPLSTEGTEPSVVGVLPNDESPIGQSDTGDGDEEAGDQGAADGTQAQDGTQTQTGAGAAGGGQVAGPDDSANGTTGQPASGSGAAGDGTDAGADASNSGDAAASDAGTQAAGDQGQPPGDPALDANIPPTDGTGVTPNDPAIPETPPAPADPVVPVTGTTVDGNTGRQLTDTTINQIVANLIKDCDTLGKGVVEEVYQYIARMRPNMPVTPADGARNQQALWATLKTMFNKVDDDFTAVFPAVLKLFEHHSNGVFAMSHRFRFIESARSMSGDDRNTYQHMVHMLVTAAPVQGRAQALNQINLAKALPAPHVTEGGRNRVDSFFNR